jgi:hypothetical protein
MQEVALQTLVRLSWKCWQFLSPYEDNPLESFEIYSKYIAEDCAIKEMTAGDQIVL